MFRVATIVFLLGLLTLAGLGVRTVVDQDRLIRTAVATPAVVTRSEVISSERNDMKGRRLRKNSPHVEYRYAVAGVEQTADTIDPSGGRFGRGLSAAETVAAFPVGKSLTAYINPRDPSAAFLEPRYSFIPYAKVLLPLLLLPLAAAVAVTALRGPARPGRATRDDDGWYRLAVRDRTVPGWIWPTTGLIGLLLGGGACLHYLWRVGAAASPMATLVTLGSLGLFVLPIWRWLTGRDTTGLEAVWVNHHPIRLSELLQVRADVPEVGEADELRLGLLCRRVERRPIHKGERYVRPVIAEAWVEARRAQTAPGHFQATLQPPQSGLASSEPNGKLPKIIWELVAERSRADGSPARTVAPIRVIA